MKKEHVIAFYLDISPAFYSSWLPCSPSQHAHAGDKQAGWGACMRRGVWKGAKKEVDTYTYPVVVRAVHIPGHTKISNLHQQVFSHQAVPTKHNRLIYLSTFIFLSVPIFFLAFNIITLNLHLAKYNFHPQIYANERIKKTTFSMLKNRCLGMINVELKDARLADGLTLSIEWRKSL